MVYTIHIDEDECIGCGACTAISDNYELEGDKAKVKKAHVAELGDNQEAIDACPKSCIHADKK